jgi:hypothetical protein
LHAGHELAGYRGDAPRLLWPRLERVFLSKRRTVDSETLSTMSISTARWASKPADHLARPSGAFEQASATIGASCLPSRLTDAPPGGLFEASQRQAFAGKAVGEAFDGGVAGCRGLADLGVGLALVGQQEDVEAAAWPLRQCLPLQSSGQLGPLFLGQSNDGDLV